jgi:transposase
VRAAAHVLHYGVGVPVRKVPAVLRMLTGVQVTQGALTQDALRQAENTVGLIYEQWRAAVPAAPVVHTDDTGWRVGGEPAHLMAFETEAATVYQVRPRHRHEEVQEVIPADYDGVMVTDRGRSYDAQAFDHVAQQKCLSHILRWRCQLNGWARKPLPLCAYLRQQYGLSVPLRG